MLPYISYTPRAISVLCVDLAASIRSFLSGDIYDTLPKR